MIFRDITHDTTSCYQLDKNEQIVFFLFNRTGDIQFELLETGAAAHVFAFFVGIADEKAKLNIIQRHLAPKTTSRVLVKSILQNSAQFSYHGTLHISADATQANASQENRNLILSPLAKAFSEPALEILTNDVRCHHAASTSPLSRETLYALETRGLSSREAQNLLITGFMNSSTEAMASLLTRANQEKVISLMENIMHI